MRCNLRSALLVDVCGDVKLTRTCYRYIPRPLLNSVRVGQRVLPGYWCQPYIFTRIGFIIAGSVDISTFCRIRVCCVRWACYRKIKVWIVDFNLEIIDRFVYDECIRKCSINRAMCIATVWCKSLHPVLSRGNIEITDLLGNAVVYPLQL